MTEVIDEAANRLVNAYRTEIFQNLNAIHH
jgi:hypothetical protein